LRIQADQPFGQRSFALDESFRNDALFCETSETICGQRTLWRADVVRKSSSGTDFNGKPCLCDARIGTFLRQQMQILNPAIQHIDGMDHS
jgi:hypothetical protein